ncbi:MAG: hypothetical protein V3U92_14285 [Cellulophaga sp.]
MTEKKVIRKKLILEGLLSLFIAITPILFYLYKYVTLDENGSTEILGITFTANGYEDAFYAFYYYSSKLIPLSLLIIWFTTCKHWWYHVILIPIGMYAYQFYVVINDDTSKIDENELKYLLVVCMIIVPIVYFIRLKLFDKHVHGIDLDAMDAEIEFYKEKERLNEDGKSDV